MGVGKGLAPAEKRKRRGVRILPAEEGDRNPGVPLYVPHRDQRSRQFCLELTVGH